MTLSDKWPMRIQSRNWWDEGTNRGHRMQRVRLGRQERDTAKLRTLALLNRAKPVSPIVVTLIRIAPRKLDEDNLQGGFKHIRDGISDALGIDDKPGSGIEWLYDQVKGESKQYAMTAIITW